MKQIFILCLVCCTTFVSYSQGIDFYHGTWSEALEQAQEQNKLIFVDAYTTWCGPCKRMSSQVFPQKSVGDYYNANFINMKLDMERGEGLKFRKKYPVSAFPTFFWIDGDGEIVYTTKGARQPADFVQLGKTAAKKYDGSAKYKVLYEDGNQDYEVVFNYVKALNKAGKSSLKVTNDYLKEQSDMTSPDNLRLIMEGATQVDSKIFGYLEKYKQDLITLEGEDVVNERIMAAANKTVTRALKYESKDLMTEALTAVQTHLPDEAGMFETDSYMKFAIAMKDGDSYLQHSKTYVKKFAGDKANKLHAITVVILKKFADHSGLVAFGEKTSKKVIDIRSTDKRIVTYATFVYLNGDKLRAIRIVDDAISVAEEENRPARSLVMLKRKFAAT